MNKLFLFLGLVASTIFFAACSVQLAPTPAAAPTALLVPTPVETYSNSKSSAITRAQLAVGASHLHLVGESPRVVMVEEMPLSKAHSIIRQRAVGPTTTAIETKSVWLVVLESDYQVFGPPGANPTPVPINHGCVFIILDSNNGSSLEITAGIPCPH